MVIASEKILHAINPSTVLLQRVDEMQRQLQLAGFGDWLVLWSCQNNNPDYPVPDVYFVLAEPIERRG